MVKSNTKGIYINDSLHGLIRLSDFEKDIISSIGFNRLHDIYQNSTVYLTYPSNRTKRFEHSIGTMKLCSDMFYAAVSNSSDNVLGKFYSSFRGTIENLIKEFIQNQIKEYESVLTTTPKEIPKIELDSFHNSLIPFNVPQNYIHLHILLIQSIQVAALLHDIGHPPFSHIVEYALNTIKNSYSEELKIKTNNQKFFLERMNIFQEEKPLHELMGNSISQDILRILIKKENKTSSDSETFFKILVAKCVEKLFADEGLFKYLHRIIDGALDGDRLDYVNRDPSNSGLNIGSIDYSRIIKEMKILYQKNSNSEPDNEPFFCVPVKSINSIEDFLRRRYDIYKNIIYHHRVIKTDFLLQNTVSNLIEQFLDNDTPQQENTNTNVIPFNISGLWFPLKNGMLNEKNCALAQWNDSWLMTILKQIYYTEYYNIPFENNSIKYKISKQLAELLENKKSYYSLIKRSEDFRIIDDEIAKQIKERSEEIENKIKELETKSREIASIDDANYIDEAGMLSYIKQLIDKCSKKQCEFFLADLFQKRNSIQFNDFKSEIRKIVSREINKISIFKVYDVQTVFKTISEGLQHPIFFYNDKDNLYALDEISGIGSTLRNENLYRPVFYIYVLVTESGENVYENKEILLKNIGIEIGKYIVMHFDTIIQTQLESLKNDI